jgi:hypothetical protein
MAGRAVANRSKPMRVQNSERAGRHGPVAVALAACRESMGVGMACGAVGSATGSKARRRARRFAGRRYWRRVSSLDG